MGAKEWTDDQKNAINASGGTLLVSAAAGSGKTAVLVQRVINRITDAENPTDADRLLVVTFTKAAAAEMRTRISSEIASLLEKDPFNSTLLRQQILLTRAHISTIDSFCSDIVKENFYKLGISPDFRILDDSEMAVLRADAVSKVLDGYYSENDADFYRFAGLFASGKSDEMIARMINRLYDFVRSHPFPRRWLDEKAEMYSSPLPAAQTVWGKTIMSYAGEAIDYCISVTQNAAALAGSDPAAAKAYSDALKSDMAGLLSLKKAATACDWDSVAFQLQNFSYQKLKPLKGCGDAFKDRIKSARKEVKDTVAKLARLFPGNEKQCGEDIKSLAPIVRKFFGVTERFAEILAEMKDEKHAADFSDLEHWTLKLLVKENEGGFEKTAYANELSGQFDEIMVDEYQDTNEAQEMIFGAVSQNGENLFFVGDVKQSIYRFRQAMPQIFLRRRGACKKYDPANESFPAYISLGKNFRSRRGVTDAVNFVFSQLMSKKAGGLDYTESEKLVPSDGYPPHAGSDAALEVIDLSGMEEAYGMVKAESARIAEIIHKMISEKYTVTDNGVQRPAVYRDFCVLLRSANKYAPEYARELTSLAVPSWADTAGGFFGTYEVGIALSLLQVIDNPLQDIPLLAVMMSPVYGFTPDDMAEIRALSRSGKLYTAVRLAAEKENARAKEFLDEISRFRVLAATMPADRLIRAVYEISGLPDIVQAMQNGSLRLANLQLLFQYAKKYEESGSGGLSGFIKFIARLKKNNSDLSAASSVSEAANVVRVMSIHRSKGLEFPVCIVAGCSRQFNRERDDTLLHPELGLGAKLKDEKTGCRFTTMPREAVSLELGRDEMSEELRVLYVAMTRAKEKLIMVATLKNAEKKVRSLAGHIIPGKPIQPYAVLGASSISDWLLLCALRHPGGQALRDMAGAPQDITVTAKEKLDINISRPQSKDENEKDEEVPQAQPDRRLYNIINDSINYKYPYAELNGVCAKVAASDLASREFSEQYAASSRPAFLSEGGLTAAERGTALHIYMQFADYKSALKSPQEELGRLVQDGFLTARQAQSVDLGRVMGFLNSMIGKRILASPHVEREYRFTVEIPAGNVKPGLKAPLKDESVIMQGAVDCAFEENGGIVIVDYKTDRVPSQAALWERYKKQLALYKFAMEKYTGKNIMECLLYSFSFGTEVNGRLD